MSNTIIISDKVIGGSQSCFIIAEVAQSHDGSLGFAHSYIDAVAQTGADAIKFQTHIAEAESSLDEPFRVKFSYEDATRYDYWKRMEFTAEQWAGIAQHCAEAGLIFLSSPFSIEAIELLDKIGMPAWKVGSGEVNNSIMLESMMQTASPILLSSGMSEWEEIDRSVASVIQHDHPLALFQCTSKYPTPLIEVGVNVIDDMKGRYNIPVGFSDHSGLMAPSLAAIARGVNLLELHVTFDRGMFGPDTKSSITFQQLKEIVDFRNSLFLMDQNPVNKDQMANSLSDMKKLFNKSIVLRKDVDIGHILEKDDLAFKKPGTGLPVDNIKNCLGRKVNKNLAKGYMLNWGDLEDSYEN